MRIYIPQDTLSDADLFEQTRSQAYAREQMSPEEKEAKLTEALRIGKLVGGDTLEDVILERITRPADEAIARAENRLGQISDSIANGEKPKEGLFYQIDINQETGQPEDIHRVIHLPDESDEQVAIKRRAMERVPHGRVNNTIKISGLPPKGPNG